MSMAVLFDPFGSPPEQNNVYTLTVSEQPFAPSDPTPYCVLLSLRSSGRLPKGSLGAKGPSVGLPKEFVVFQQDVVMPYL
jgi:hypothetical protein